MGPVERELRDAGEAGRNPQSRAAWGLFESCHRGLMRQHTGELIGYYPGCCKEAMSEAIEAAEALGL